MQPDCANAMLVAYPPPKLTSVLMRCCLQETDKTADVDFRTEIEPIANSKYRYVLQDIRKVLKATAKVLKGALGSDVQLKFTVSVQFIGFFYDELPEDKSCFEIGKKYFFVPFFRVSTER